MDTKHTPIKFSLRLTIALFFITSFPYFYWRLSTFNPDALFFSYTLYALELYGLITILLYLFSTTKLSSRSLKKAKEGLNVDVFIATYNESIEIIRRTIVGVKNMDYSHETWVLDDGNRDEVKVLTEQLGVKYLSRKSNEDAKAGNLNNALHYSSADLIALFDVDHIPSHAFLTDTLGFFNDQDVAFVQTPQEFYNLDSFQHQELGGGVVWSEQTLFFRVIQRGKDYWNSAFFCGSCAVIRKSALDAIGGFATGTITEDLHTSIRLHKAGFKSVYWHIPLAFGLAPFTLKQFLLQRLRWGRGAMQVWWREGIFFNKGLTVPQKINYFTSILTYFDGVQKFAFYLTPIIIIFTGILPIEATAKTFLIFFLPYMTFSYLLFEELSRGYGRFLMQEKYQAVRFFTFMRVAFSFLSNLNYKFEVTPKSNEAQDEYWSYAPLLLVLIGSAIAIIYGLYFEYTAMKGAIYVAIFWASFNFYAFFLALAHAFKNKGRLRVDYRFKLPHACLLQINNQITDCLVDDISAGCKLYGNFPSNMQINQSVGGSLLLYSGEAFTFKATVKAINYGWSKMKERYIKSIGIQFEHNPQDQFFLDGYLYGDNLQWTINNITEHGGSILDRILNSFKKGDKLNTHYRSEDWKILRNDRNQIIGIIATKDTRSTYGRIIYLNKKGGIASERHLQIETKSSVNRISITILSETKTPCQGYIIYIHYVSIVYD